MGAEYVDAFQIQFTLTKGFRDVKKLPGWSLMRKFSGQFNFKERNSPF